ncbi:MAG: carbohydrate binding domain-containing protein, partial [Bryobacteraceae bacterium]
VVGIVRTIEAVGANFISWSDGGAKLHSISTPASNTTYTARFGGGGGTGTNLIVNPGFEAGAQGWTNAIGSGTGIVTTQAHSGTKSLQFRGSSTADYDAYQEISVSGGSNYNVNVWMKPDRITSGATIVLVWTNRSGLPPAIPPASVLRRDTAPFVAGTLGWTQRSLTLTAPIGAVAVRVRFDVPKQSDSAGTLWVDDVSLVQIP